jgi:glycosyltransferase involved in cell wall biosynthesis
MPPSAPRLSVVVPAYNEAESLRPLVEALRRSLDGLGEAYELLVVDDGSTDGTRAVLDELAPRHPCLRVLRLVRNAGQSAAFLAGFDAAAGEVVVTLDADLQNDPADIPRLLAALPGHDAVLGVRATRRDDAVRRLSSRVANAVRRAATGDGLTDVGCSLKAFRREHLRDLPRFDGVHRFFGTLLVWKGCRVVELPVGHHPRRAGQAKYNLRNRAARTLADLFAMRWWRTRAVRYEIER